MLPHRNLCDEDCRYKRGKLVLVVHSTQIYNNYTPSQNDPNNNGSSHTSTLEAEQQMDQHNRSNYAQDYIFLILAVISALFLCIYKTHYRHKHNVSSQSGWIKFHEMKTYMHEYRKFIQTYKSTIWNHEGVYMDAEYCKNKAKQHNDTLSTTTTPELNTTTETITTFANITSTGENNQYIPEYNFIQTPRSVIELMEKQFGKGLRLNRDRFLEYGEGMYDPEDFNKYKDLIDKWLSGMGRGSYSIEFFCTYLYNSAGSNWRNIELYLDSHKNTMMTEIETKIADDSMGETAAKEFRLEAENEIKNEIQSYVALMSDMYLKERETYYNDYLADLDEVLNDSLIQMGEFAIQKAKKIIELPAYKTTTFSGLMAMSQNHSIEARIYSDLNKACVLVPIGCLTFGICVGLSFNYCCGIHFFNPWTPLLECLHIMEKGSEMKLISSVHTEIEQE